jgi:hypothetical protein
LTLPLGFDFDVIGGSVAVAVESNEFYFIKLNGKASFKARLAPDLTTDSNDKHLVRTSVDAKFHALDDKKFVVYILDYQH